MASDKPKADWEAIERDFRCGLFTLEEIGRKHGITKGRISQISKRDGWTRDLVNRINARAIEKLAEAEVTRKNKPYSDREAVEANADVIFQIVEGQRQDIPKKRNLVAKLFAEIEAQTDNGDLIETLKISLGQGDMAQLATTVSKLTSLPSRIKGTTDLVTAYKVLIELERRIYGLDNDKPADPYADLPRDEVLRRLAELERKR